MPEFIRTTEPLTAEDPSLAWLRAEHPEVLEARGRPHEYAPDPVMAQLGRVAGGEPSCAECWMPRKRPWHRGGGAS